MIYKFNSKKHRKCHIVNEDTGLTYCKAENGMTDLNETETFVPQQREVCSNCVEARDGKQKKRRTSKIKNELKLNFYSTDAWIKLRFDVLKDATHCLCCGASKKEARLTADHVKPIWKHPELKLDKGNLQVLCMLCNKGKGGRNETDFRN